MTRGRCHDEGPLGVSWDHMQTLEVEILDTPQAALLQPGTGDGGAASPETTLRRVGAFPNASRPVTL